MSHAKSEVRRVGASDAVLIAGPTASGKSALALDLAARIGGVVINADSMQVYRDLRIITARPTPEDEARVPHALYGHVDAAENYSVGRWCSDAAEAMNESRVRGLVPIITGGTGLYYKALTQGLSAIPPVSADIRAATRARLAAEGVEALHAELASIDPPAAARLMPRDATRITRAIEVFAATGRPLTDWHREGLRPLLDPQRAIGLFLMPDRAVLYARIAARFDAMLEAGALDEVAALDARRLDPALPAMKAHGVPWLRRHLAGDLSLEEAAEEAMRDTRRYTKRQLTWFRNQMPGWDFVAPEAARDHILGRLTPGAT